MTQSATTDRVALVNGASRGFGRAIATALHSTGAQVVGVARNAGALAELQLELGTSFTAEAGDATDPVLAGSLIERYRPTTLVLNAGAALLSRPIHQHTWQSFSRNWKVDVRHAFHWIREALHLPLDPGSSVIAMSSGAALNGSPLSGGYAGAKATIRFVTGYAAEESARAGLGIRFLSVLPRLTPATDLGASAVAAYARRAGLETEAFLEQFGPTLTVDQVGKAVVELADSADHEPRAYVLTAAGLEGPPVIDNRTQTTTHGAGRWSAAPRLPTSWPRFMP